MSEVSASPIFSYTFSDPDELESLFNRQQSFHVMQLDLQPMRCHLLHLKLDGAEFAFRELHNPIRVWGNKKPNTLVFEFLMSPPQAELLSHGYAIQPNTLYGFDSTRGIDMVMPAKTMLGSLLIQRHILEEYLHLMDRTDLDDRFWASNAVQNPTAFAPVQRYLRELFSLVQQRASFFEQPQASKLILEDYLPLLIAAIPPMGNQRTRTTRLKPRMQLVRQAEEYMLANLEQPITLKSLCQSLHTSSSPLNYGFKEVLGISPMTYLRVLRLHAIHKALKAADPTTTKVVDLALKFGFWHAGRFSQYYQQMFGKPPSVTLKH